jgi:hypothetical protein
MATRTFNQLQQAVGNVHYRVPLAQLQECPWPTTVLGRYSASAADADWVASVRLKRQDLLEAHVVLPTIGEVVLVQEALADAQSNIKQPHSSRLSRKPMPPR